MATYLSEQSFESVVEINKILINKLERDGSSICYFKTGFLSTFGRMQNSITYNRVAIEFKLEHCLAQRISKLQSVVAAGKALLLEKNSHIIKLQSDVERLWFRIITHALLVSHQLIMLKCNFKYF